MQMLVQAAAIAAYTVLCISLGHWFTKKLASWSVDNAMKLSDHWEHAAEKAQDQKALFLRVEQQLENSAHSMHETAKRLEALDFNVGQLTLRLVKEQVRVRGVQVGEEITDSEHTTGRRSTAPPIERGDESATDGFFVDGKPVDPQRGLERTIASAQPT